MDRTGTTLPNFRKEKLMITAKGIQGKYLEYMGKPLVRYDNEIYYGDMADKYILFLMVMQQKKIEKLNVEVPSKVMV